jgi:hypothetical protein
MTPEQKRKQATARVMAMFRPSQVLIDEAGHTKREIAFSQWFIRNEALTREVAARIAEIGDAEDVVVIPALRWWRNRCARKRTRQEREAIARRAREEAFGPLDERTRAEDRQRLADAAAGKGRLI